MKVFFDGVSERVERIQPPDGPADRAARQDAWIFGWHSHESRDEVGKIAVPTLILAGDHDRQDPLEQHHQEVLARIPGATLRVVEDSGHLSPLEQPRRLAEAVAIFASGVQR